MSASGNQSASQVKRNKPKTKKKKDIFPGSPFTWLTHHQMNFDIQYIQSVGVSNSFHVADPPPDEF